MAMQEMNICVNERITNNLKYGAESVGELGAVIFWHDCTQLNSQYQRTSHISL